MGSLFSESPLLPELPNLPEIESTDLADFAVLVGQVSQYVGGISALGGAGAAVGVGAGATSTGGTAVSGFFDDFTFGSLLETGAGVADYLIERDDAKKAAEEAAKRDQQQAAYAQELALARLQFSNQVQEGSQGAGWLNSVPLPSGLSPMLLFGGLGLLVVAFAMKGRG